MNQASSNLNSPQEAWQTSRATIKERMAFLVNNSLMSDVLLSINVKESNGQLQPTVVPAHKLVLAASSQVFQDIFYGRTSDSKDDKQPSHSSQLFSVKDNILNIAFCSSKESLIEFLHFVYSDEANLDADNVFGVMCLAKEYEMSLLFEKCERFLEGTVDKSDAFDCLMKAQELGASRLQKRCWDIIEIQTKGCLEAEGLLCLNLPTLTSLLKREKLNVDECSLFKSVHIWAKFQCDVKQTECCGENLRKILSSVMSYLRFPAMKPEEFNEHVAGTGLLSPKEIIDIFVRFYSKSNLNPVLNLEEQFPCTPRTGRDLTRCCRLHKWPTWFVGNHAGHKYLPEKVEEIFQVTSNNEIFLGGFRLYAGENEKSNFRVELCVSDQAGKEFSRVLAICCTSEGGINNWNGFDIFFDVPVRLVKMLQYTISCSIKCESRDCDGKAKVFNNFTSGASRVKERDIEVSFSGEFERVVEVLFYDTFRKTLEGTDNTSEK